ncbi:MAG: hypothetical protein KF724_00690 [Phycisphaeraceae bacterium]|nr:hypothetical protein [Phycisphaeraceae bacterium]
MNRPSSGNATPGDLEVERTFLLRAMPTMPPGSVEVLRIEQGYLPAGGEFEGRFRRTVDESGREAFVHTVKRGLGLVREEVEREIDAATFFREWPRTVGRRLRKTRHRVRGANGLTWEIDEFHGLPPVEGRALVMAEVEIPHGVDPAAVTPPEWLRDLIVREVTDEPRFRNFALAAASATI